MQTHTIGSLYGSEEYGLAEGAGGKLEGLSGAEIVEGLTTCTLSLTTGRSGIAPGRFVGGLLALKTPKGFGGRGLGGGEVLR